MGHDKKVKIDFDGLNGNAFSLVAAWSSAARKQGISNHDITMVTQEAFNGDYNHLIQTLLKHSEQ